MGRFAKKRWTAEERLDRKIRRHEHLRQIKGHYVHSDRFHGQFRHPGDETLTKFLSMFKTNGPVLMSASERHVKMLEAQKWKCIWQVENQVSAEDVMLGKIFRRPDICAPLTTYSLDPPVAGAFVCERLEEQPNLEDYLVALREAVALDGPIALVVPNVHHELVNDHVNLFTAGTLIYNLVRAGWNCRDAEVNFDKRFINVIVRRLDLPEPWPRTVDEAGRYMPFKNVFQFCSSEFPEVYRGA